MTHGTHVIAEECEQMRDLHERGYFYGIIAQRFDVSVDTVNYHVNERCSHD